MGDAKKIAIISPYFDILGGGERYILAIAEILSKTNLVTIFWKDNTLENKASKKFGIKLSNIRIETRSLKGLGLINALRVYDELIYMTDGSLFLSPCKNNVLIIQSPAHIPLLSMSNNIKLNRFQTILCYSAYVAGFIQKKIRRKPLILPPPINMPIYKNDEKENIILSVGRFFPWLHNKRQDVLVSVFKSVNDNKTLKDWRLVLIGSVDKGAESYVSQIKKEIVGYPIEVFTDVDFNNLTSFYKRSKIYWHGAGFGQDLKKHPENAEHFGITTVEAMSFGCVPIVFNAGGQPEIVNSRNGFLWETKEQLSKNTLSVINDPKLLNKLSGASIERSEDYSLVKFKSQLKEIL